MQSGGQILGLLLSNFIGLPLGILISILLAKILGPVGFGNYSYLISVLTFCSLIGGLGLFYAGSRAILLTNSIEGKRSIYGVELIFLFLIFTIVSTLLVIYASIDVSMYEKNLTGILLSVIPIGLVILMGNYFDILLPADNKIKYLSFYRIFSKFLHLVFLIVFLLIDYKFFKNSHEMILIFYIFFISYFLSGFLIFYKLKLNVTDFKKNVKTILNYNRNYGFDLYLGGVVAVGFVCLTPVLIGYFSNDNKEVGFFTLALTFCAPISMIPNTIGTVYYKSFSVGKRIELKKVVVTWGLGALAVIFLLMIIGFLVRILYGDGFYEVIDLVYILAFGFLIHGIGDFYNKFLSANGKSKAIRNNAFIVGVFSIIIGVLLISQYGAYGAAYSRLIIGVVYLSLIYMCYINYFKKDNFKTDI